MALPLKPNNPNTPIPNNPFYSDEVTYFDGPYYPAVINSTSGIAVGPNGVVSVTGGGGGAITALNAGVGIALSSSTGNVTVCTNLAAGTNIALTPSGNLITISATGLGTGTVTAITAGNGLSGGTITTSGSLSLNTSCVIPPNAFNIKGNLLVGTAAGSYTALNPGSDGQVLIACASAGGAGGPGMCWSSVGSVTSVTGTLPISVATGTTTPAISIAAASTTGSGAVQLNDTLTSTSTTLALTAAQGKVLQDQIDTLLVAGTIELAGTIDASTGFVASVTSVGTADGYAVGAVLPAASATTNNTYVIVTTPGTITPPGGASTVATRGDWFLVSETSPGVFAWTFLNVGFDAPAASTTVPGIVELATNAETATGTDATTAVTPAGAAFAYIAKTALTAKGALVSATAASTPSALAVGSDGQVLVACAAATTGLCWTAPAATGIPCACITAKGSLVSGTAAATPTALPVGTDGNVLVACALAPTGLCWTAPAASGIPCACVLGKGALITGTAGSTPAGLPVGLDGQSLVACAACACGLTWGGVGAQATPVDLGTVYACTTISQAALGFEAARCSTGAAGDSTAIGTCALWCSTTPLDATAIGARALLCLTTGCRNVAVGTASLASNVTGQGNSALGYLSLSGTTGGFNTALGYCAGNTVTTGICNVLIGSNSQPASPTDSCSLRIGFDATNYWLTGNSTKAIKPGAGIIDCAASTGTAGQVLMSNGSNAICWGSAGGSGSPATPTVAGIVKGCTTGFNSALGANALLSLTTGSCNTAIGVNALQSNSTGSCNTANGVGALTSNTTGSINTANGVNALTLNTTGNQNTANGFQALRSNTTGSLNTANGYHALYSNTTGNNNTANGQLALFANTTASNNTAVGFNALCANISGCLNVAVGICAGGTITTGCQNVALGPNAAVTSATGSCQLAIGFSATCNWLTGCSDKSIQPGAGIRDCLGCVGTKGQVLTATGCALGSSVEWRNLPGCAVIRSSSMTSTFGAAFTPITVCYGTALTDTTGWYNGTTGVFRPNIAGYYQISAMARTCTLNTGIGESVISIICNGTNIINVGSYGQINGSVNTLVCMNGTTDALCVQISAAASGTGCTITQPSSSRFTALLMALA